MENLVERRSRCGSVSIVLFVVCACSSSPEKNPLPNATVESGNAGAVVQAPTVTPGAGGSGDQPGAPAMNVPSMMSASGGTGGMAMAAAGTGGQMAAADAGAPPYMPDLVFTMHGTIEGGAEAMFCMFAQLPTGQKTAVPSAESHYTPGSHHFLVFRTNLTSIPQGGDVAHLCGTTDTTVAVAGGNNGISSAESVMGSTGSYYEAQVPDSRRDLPPGVAHVFAPGEILLLTAHYLNTSEKTIDSTIEFRLHLEDPADVKQEAGTFFLLNTQLNIPANSAVTFTRTCPIPKDLNLGILWSHMHARGYAFRAWTDDPVAMQQLGGDVYDQPGPDGWAEPHVQNYPYDPPVTLHAGSNLIFSCTYHNMTSQSFVFGQSAATGEMCLLHGMYWPRMDMNTERCTNGTTMGDAPTPLPAGGT